MISTVDVARTAPRHLGALGVPVATTGALPRSLGVDRLIAADWSAESFISGAFDPVHTWQGAGPLIHVDQRPEFEQLFRVTRRQSRNGRGGSLDRQQAQSDDQNAPHISSLERRCLHAPQFAGGNHLSMSIKSAERNPRVPDSCLGSRLRAVGSEIYIWAATWPLDTSSRRPVWSYRRQVAEIPTVRGLYVVAVNWGSSQHTFVRPNVSWASSALSTNRAISNLAQDITALRFSSLVAGSALASGL